jgi:aspartate aminotransferase-like enzyme
VRDAMRDTEASASNWRATRQLELGAKCARMLVGRGFASVAAAGFEAPGVVVSYTTDPEIQSAKKFVDLGLQAAAGVPLQCDEGTPTFRSFRLGLFGLDKLGNVERTVASLRQVLDRLA